MKKLGVICRLMMLVVLLASSQMAALAVRGGQTGSAAAGCVVFDGLEHCPIQGTTLSASSASQLQVTRPGGSTAPFGVTVHPSGQTAWDGTFEPVRLSGESRMQMSFSGGLPNGQEEAIGKIATVSMPGSTQKAVYADFSISTSSARYTIRGFNHGTQVFTRTGVTPTQVVTLDPQTKAPQLWWVVAWYVLDHASAHVEYSQQNGWSGGVDWNSSSLLDLDNDGTPEFEGDKIMISPENQTYSSHTLSSVNLQGQGQSFERFVIKTRFMDGGCFDMWDLLRHCPAGRAQLSSSPAGSELYVDNIGSSGQDGVSMTPRGRSRWDGYFAPVRLGNEGRMMLTAYGQMSDGPARLGHIITASRPDLGPARKGLYVDWSPLRPVSYGLRGYSGTTLVLSRTIVPPAGATALNPDSQFPIIPILIALYVLDHASAHVEHTSSGWSGGVDWNSSMTADTDGDGIDDFRGDRLMVVAQGSAMPATTLDTITLGASNISRLTMRNSHPARCVDHQGRVRCALGQAEVSSSSAGGSPRLHVTSIGSSGQDGVSFDVSTQAAPNLHWGDPHVNEKDGTRLMLALAGPSGTGGEEQILGSSSIARAGGSLMLSADFSGAGSSTVQATAYRNGAVVYSGSLPNGVLASVSSAPTGGDLDCAGCVGFSWGVSNPTHFVVPGSPPFDADLWVVRASLAHKAAPSSVTSLRLLANDIDELTLEEVMNARYQLFLPVVLR